jgi:G3E family GTPase
VAAPAAATPAPASASAAASIGAQLGFVDVLPTRSPDRIKALMDNAVALEREAGIDLANAQSEKGKTKALIESKKGEISAIDSKRKAAEKAKQEAEKIAFEAEKKDAERQKAFLERRSDLHDAEIERAKALQKMAAASTRALQLEQELGSRRAARGTSSGDPAGARRQDAVIVELEGRGLEAKRQQAEAEKGVADKDVDLARRRIELHKAQTSAAGMSTK